MGLKLGMLGSGAVAASIHLVNLRRRTDVRITAIAEPDAARRARAAALAPGSAMHADWREVVDRDDVDAVLVCLPTALHAEATAAALSAGRHVYVEKPLATHAGECDAVFDAWLNSGRIGMVGFNLRFDPLLLEARALLADGRIGEPLAFRSVFATPTTALPDWKLHRATGGGVLLDLASHHVDLVRFMLGREVIAVSAFTRTGRSEMDSATLALRLEGDIHAQSFFSFDANEEDRIEVYGTLGKLAVHRYLSLAVELYRRPIAAARRDALVNRLRAMTRAGYALRRRQATAGQPSYAAAMNAFLVAIRGGPVRYPDLEDGLRCVRVIDAALASADTGQAVPPTSSGDEARTPNATAAGEKAP